MTKLPALFLICLTLSPTLSSDPVPFTINSKKWSHVLDDHFISITVNPTDILQGKVYGLAMNSTMAILKGLAPAYVRIGSADTAKYTFKKNRYPSDMVKPEDEYTVTETHWMVFNEVAQSAGLDVIVCLNAAHKVEGSKKWDTRNSLELISFSDSQGYNLTFQLGYEVQTHDEISGLQFGKDLNRLRTILNAFPRYQNAKLIGPDIRVVHKKEEIDFWNDVLVEAGPTLDAVTWHPRWPQPSKMKVSDNSDLGYEFPNDYLEYDKVQLNKILQRSVFKNPIWIGETKTESTGTFAEGLIWARRLVLAAKSGVEVVMKQPNLMDISHPKPEYWIALLHKRLLGKSVLETRSVVNATDLAVISHCTNPMFWSDKPEKLQDGAVTVYAVNMGGFDQKIQIKGTWPGKSQLMFQYVLTSGSDPDSVFSQMTYLNGEPLMMTDDGLLPDIIPRIKKMEKGLTMKLPPYSIGFWVIPEARVKICQIQPYSVPTIHIETQTSAVKSAPKNLQNIQDINQFLVEKLKNPESESDESTEMKIEEASSESLENDKDLPLLSKENNLPRVARRIRQIKPLGELNKELKTIIQETEEFLMKPDLVQNINSKFKLPKPSPNMEQRIHKIAEGISDAIKTTNQEHEFNKFLEDSGLKKDFGSLLITDRLNNAPKMVNSKPMVNIPTFDIREVNQRLKRSILSSEEDSLEKTDGDEEEYFDMKNFAKKLSLIDDLEDKTNKKQDLLIPHHQDLKGLEEKYKFVVQSKIQDGKRKIDDLKRNMKLGEREMSQMIKPPVPNHDIQEEIIKKEIELLEKTEEKVADILNNQKKQQEAFKDIIFDELNDVKDERISALREMYKNQRKNSILKRQEQTNLNKPLLKTVEYIEKNFNLEPESVRKIKRSLEEKMGEILNNFDKRKSMEIKKRMVQPKEEKKLTLKRRTKENKEEELEKRRLKGDLPRSYVRKSNKLHHTSRLLRKPETVSKESFYKTKKSEEEKVYEEENDSFEMFNQKKLDESKKPEHKSISFESIKQAKKESRNSRKEETPKMKLESQPKKKLQKEKTESLELEKIEEVMEENKPEPTPELRPIKNDKERRENMLKQITSIVDSMDLKGERLKRMEEEEGISEEFETDTLSRKFKRRPRKVEMTDILPDTVESQIIEKTEEIITEAPVTSTTSATKTTKTRKRIQPNRKLKNIKKTSEVNEEEKVDNESLSSQKKRHLDKPLTENGKLPKPRKLADYYKTVLKKKPKKVNAPEIIDKLNEESQKTVLELTGTPIPITDPSEDPKKELAEIGEKKEVLDENPQDIKEEMEKNVDEILEQKKENVDKSGELSKQAKEIPDKNREELLEQKQEDVNKNGEQQLGKKIDTDFSGETPTPTEGYIVVEPTTEEGMEEKMVTEKLEMQTAKNPTTDNDVVEERKEPMESENESLDSELFSAEKKSEEDRSDYIGEPFEPFLKAVDPYELEYETIEDEEDEKVKENDSQVNILNVDSDIPKQEISKVKESLMKINKIPLPDASSTDPKSDIAVEGTDIIITPPVSEAVAMAEAVAPKLKELANNQRKRRATFLTHRPASDDEEDEEDYSSEERIKKFKQMIYKKSPAKKLEKNEVRPSGGMGMGADEFIRMAGSTVRVMFDDVIPEAYGQTKSKIQNMGIPEYIKEFGKIVQQMKNLDQIFLNIGEAAVKGYIKGNKEEKGPYIQVISRKKRSARPDDLVTDVSTSSIEESTTTEVGQPMHQTEPTVIEVSPMVNDELENTRTGQEMAVPTGSNREAEYARTSTQQTLFADKPRSDWIVGERGSKSGKGIYTGAGWRIPNTSDAGKSIEAEKTEIPQEILTVNPETSDILDLESFKKPIKALKNQIPTIAKRIQPFIETAEKKIAKASETASDDLAAQISPWIKTTKDFIRQAFTTLQRQKELSEILATDLMSKEEALRKAIGKRETEKVEPQLPVYHMVPSASNRKRETHNKQSESLIRQLRGLQPGVYVVPTEEMTNVRSEQITSEAQAKSGQPNVVTLNIYYDKKNSDASAKADAATHTAEPTLSQDMVTYYQNKIWNTAGQYDQNNQYVSPVIVPESNLPNPLVPPVQVTPGVQYPTADISNSRLLQYPSTNLHHPGLPRFSPTVPNPQPVYNPGYYLPPDTRFLSQPPGTRRQWREFRARSSGVPVPINAINNGWNIQYETVPGSVRSTLKPLTGSSYNKNFKLFADKKRSIGDPKINLPDTEAGMPIWKFFPSSSSEKIYNRVEEKASEEKQLSESFEDRSSEEIFEKNKKRIKQAKKKVKEESVEEEPENEEEVKIEKEEEEVDKSRKRRSISENNKNELDVTKKLFKRSYPYHVEFKDHDILPEWFGTYQEIGNSLNQLPTHARRSHIISTPWSNEDEELLALLDGDDEPSLIDLGIDDYYYANDNSIGQLRRYSRSRRSTDQSESNMIKSNMIYKKSINTDNAKPKTLGMTGIKKLTDEDSSLELMTKPDIEIKSKLPETKEKSQDEKGPTKQPLLTETTTKPPMQPKLPPQLQLQLQQLAQPLLIQQQKLQEQQLQPLLVGPLPLNDTTMLPRNPNDDSLYYFFKYAYDSLVKVMKNMSQLF